MSRRFVSAASAGWAAVVAAVPAIAQACPYCAAKGADHWTLYFIGAMVVLPFAVSGVVIRAVRRMDSDSNESRNEQ